MKRFFPVWIMLLFSIAAFAQKGVTIEGTILNPKESEVTVAIPALQADGEAQQFKAPLNSQGAFSLKVPVTKATSARLMHGGEYTNLYLQPGKNFSLSLNTESFDESISYKGAGAAANGLHAALLLRQGETDAQMKDNIIALAPAAFKQWATAERDAQLAVVNEKGSAAPKDLQQLLESNIRYSWGLNMMQYPMAKAYLTGSKEKPVLPADWEAYKKELPLQNEAALQSDIYTFYVLQSLMHQFAAEQGNAPGKNPYVWAYETAAAQLKGEPLTKIQSMILNQGLSQGNLDALQPLANDFLKRNNKSPYAASVAMLLKQNKGLAAGNPAPGFTLTSIDGKEVSLSDFKGKVVYLDFWASWCKPCLGEMPASKELKAHFKDRDDVVFLYVSIDDNAEAWKKMVAKQEIEGIHLLSQGWKGTASKAYNVSSIPRYVLIDRQGNIIDANTSRPSAAETRENIEKALATNE